MKNVLFNILYKVSIGWNYNRFIDISHQDLILPFYHAVNSEKPPHIRHLAVSRDVKIFEEDLLFFSKYYKAISLRELYEHIYNVHKLSYPAYHLTFDDGLKECITTIAPILYKKGISATFFINSAFVDNRDMFYRYKVSLLIDQLTKIDAKALRMMSDILVHNKVYAKSLKEQLLSISYANRTVLDELAPIANIDFQEYLSSNEVYMTREDILSLKKMGFTIGAHSVDHPFFSQISYQEQLRQVKDSCTFVKEQFQQDYRCFSFPFSDDGVQKALFEEILFPRGDLGLSFGISGLKKDITPYHLHRIPMEKTGDSAEKSLRKEYIYYLLKSLVDKNEIYRD